MGKNFLLRRWNIELFINFYGYTLVYVRYMVVYLRPLLKHGGYSSVG